MHGLAAPETSRGLPPGPALTQMPKVLRGLRRDPLRLLSTLTRRYGDVVRLRFWLWDAYVVWRPEHVKHVLQDRHTIYTKGKPDYRVLKRILGDGLVTSDGRFWLRQRRLMQPAFHRDSIARFAPIMVERTAALLKGWEEAARRGRPVDVPHEMRRLSLDVVTRALFGVSVHDQARAVGRASGILSAATGSGLAGLIAFAIPFGGWWFVSRKASKQRQLFDELLTKGEPSVVALLA